MPNSPIAYQPGSSWRRTSLFTALFLVLFFLGASSTLALAGLPPATSYAGVDPGIAVIISQVTSPTLAYELSGLTGERPVLVDGITTTIQTRKTHNIEAMQKATQYAYEQFVSYGLETTYQDYIWTVEDTSFVEHSLAYSNEPYAARNVVAEKPGLVDPLRIYLLTAHIDDQPMGLRAPGADDNASGSVAVMTAARLLAAEDLAYTVRFVLFTGEEQGLHGSAAYAAQCAAKQEDIRGVINLDMIAYNSDPAPIVDLYAIHDVPASVALTRQFAYVVRAYDLDVIPHRFADSAGMPTSDQGSFIAWGYPVMLVIEDMDDFSPHWHKITDRLVTLDLDYYTANTRAVVATIAHLAVPIR